jgi:hypothetical protein
MFVEPPCLSAAVGSRIGRLARVAVVEEQERRIVQIVGIVLV